MGPAGIGQANRNGREFLRLPQTRVRGEPLQDLLAGEIRLVASGGGIVAVVRDENERMTNGSERRREESREHVRLDEDNVTVLNTAQIILSGLVEDEISHGPERVTTDVRIRRIARRSGMTVEESDVRRLIRNARTGGNESRGKCEQGSMQQKDAVRQSEQQSSKEQPSPSVSEETRRTGEHRQSLTHSKRENAFELVLTRIPARSPSKNHWEGPMTQMKT